jgi:hypothetical protein
VAFPLQMTCPLSRPGADFTGRGARGTYRVSLCHGVSRVTSGQRYTLGVIFHDAK